MGHRCEDQGEQGEGKVSQCLPGGVQRYEITAVVHSWRSGGNYLGIFQFEK